MKAVIQRVNHASVAVDGEVQSQIKKGLLVLLGITATDTVEDSGWLSKKIVHLRIFNDDRGIMNDSLLDIDGEILIVSQFTLLASTKKGNRPSYIKAANAETATPLYEQFIKDIENCLEKKAGTGTFGADMKINLENDGPVTVIIDTEFKQ